MLMRSSLICTFVLLFLFEFGSNFVVNKMIVFEDLFFLIGLKRPKLDIEVTQS